MVKANVKKFGYILSVLFLIGVMGFGLSLGELNARYEMRTKMLGVLASRVSNLQKRIDVRNLKMSEYRFMEYKVNAFASRYPQFSHILDTVYRKSFKYGFKPGLVLGIMKVESDYNPTAVSYRGAYGLMQVNLGVWKDELKLDSRCIFNVDYNVDIGLKILKTYYDLTHGNLKRALYLYNNGYRYTNSQFVAKVDSAAHSFTSGLTVNEPEVEGLGY
ncbi:MAG: lytic transglycosylase domain-containing protein [Candidatus Omnitrophota bacterium]